ncbi:MAG TPA: Wzz/FepE/Etk N-terminal domain-containing protein, partial [Desulfatiglandales bacterium]|nr:Wzz/FepE/Etk N-terminal domain-containing protein [Desulfatiglandales bacterium]
MGNRINVTQEDQINKVPDMRISSPQEDSDDEINLIDLLYPIYKRRRFLTWFCVGIAIAIGIISILLPRTYQATAVILPQTSERSGSLTQSLTSAFLEQFGVSGL